MKKSTRTSVPSETTPVSFRLAGWELDTLNRVCDLLGVSRSDGRRRSAAELESKMAASHPVWPLHPDLAGVSYLAPGWHTESALPTGAWLQAIASIFSRWSFAITAENPLDFLEPCQHEGRTVYRFRKDADFSGNSDWEEHFAKHQERECAAEALSN